MFTFINGILLLGAAQGCVLALLLLFRRRENIIANKILAGILMVFSLSILLHVLSHVQILPLGHVHETLIGAMMLLTAPAVYLYTIALTSVQFRPKKTDLFHLLPFAASLIFVIDDPAAPGTRTIFHVLLITMIGGYALASNVVLFRHRRIVKENFSSLQKVNLGWLRAFIFSLTAFWLVAATFELFFNTEPWDIVWIVSCIVIYLIGYFGFMQPEIFSSVDAGTQAAGRKYEKSSLSPELADQQLRKLASWMETAKPYLDKDLTLARLAQQTAIPLHHLSQIINERTGASFYDYINTRRVEEAKRMLLDPGYRCRNIASIGFDAGFNSLSAFNTAFRKFVNTTPSQFRSQSSG